MVSQSREVSALVGLLAAGVTTYLMSPSMGRQISDFMREVFNADVSLRADPAAYFAKALHVMAAVALPVCLSGFVFGIASSFAQIGSVFSWDPIQPDWSKINPVSGFQKFFSMRQVYDGLRVILKTAAVLLVAYGVIKSQILGAPSYLAGEAGDLMPAYGHAAKGIFLSLVLVLAVFAAIDYGLQKMEFSKNLRMTKQEAKQEHKEREGDPQIKARIRSIQREMARRRMMQAVRTADVIVTNPTHIAIAIVYDKENMMAPKVVAKGADFIAQKIKKVAADAGVPLVENVPLARTLYKSVKVGQQIPRVLYQAVAEVLAYVYRLRNRNQI